jgi:hypothetical protein
MPCNGETGRKPKPSSRMSGSKPLTWQYLGRTKFQGLVTEPLANSSKDIYGQLFFLGSLIGFFGVAFFVKLFLTRVMLQCGQVHEEDQRR